MMGKQSNNVFYRLFGYAFLPHTRSKKDVLPLPKIRLKEINGLPDKKNFRKNLFLGDGEQFF